MRLPTEPREPDVMPGAERRQERTLAPDEIRAVWAAADELGYPFGLFFKMALARGQRREEIAQMRWADIDDAERTWTHCRAR